MSFLSEWRDWWWAPVLLVAFVGFTGAALYYQAKYINEHHCVRTGNVHTTTTIVYQKIGDSSYPQFIESTSYQYACDGGEVVWF